MEREEFISLFKTSADPSYKKYLQEHAIGGKKKILGVRSPKIKEIVKEISWPDEALVVCKQLKS